MTEKKGIALPINMLVILAVAVIVLLAVVAFFMNMWNPDSIEGQKVSNKCCRPVAMNPGHWCNDSKSWSDTPHGDSVTVSENDFKCKNYVGDITACPACEQIE